MSSLEVTPELFLSAEHGMEKMQALTVQSITSRQVMLKKPAA